MLIISVRGHCLHNRNTNQGHPDDEPSYLRHKQNKRRVEIRSIISTNREMDLLLDHRIISGPVPSRPISESYADTAFFFFTLDNSVYQLTRGKCIDLRENSVLLKIKLEESALVNVNKYRCSLKSIHLGVN